MSDTDRVGKDDLIVIAGAGGFIAGASGQVLSGPRFHPDPRNRQEAAARVVPAVPGVESLCLDLSEQENCEKACEGAVEVYNLAADMGGMGSSSDFASSACAAS